MRFWSLIFLIVILFPLKLFSLTVVTGGSEYAVVPERSGGNEERTLTINSGTVYWVRLDAFRYPEYAINANSQDTGRFVRNFNQ